MNEQHVMNFTMEEPWRVFHMMEAQTKGRWKRAVYSLHVTDEPREATEFIKKHRPASPPPASH